MIGARTIDQAKTVRSTKSDPILMSGAQALDGLEGAAGSVPDAGEVTASRRVALSQPGAHKAHPTLCPARLRRCGAQAEQTANR